MAIAPEEIRWFPMKGFSDGRKRAVLVGNPETGGSWTSRTKVEAPIVVLPHTHPVDEHITILEGTWYLGLGRSYVEQDLKAYPAGSFVVIPAGVPHFVATKGARVVL